MNRKEAGSLGGQKTKLIHQKQKQARIDEYDKNPKHCLFCKKSIEYQFRRNNFCCHSCSASATNKNRSKTKISCLFCGKQTNNPKYCSHSCANNYEWDVTKQNIKESGELERTNSGYGYNPSIAKRYLSEEYGRNCSICGLTHWQSELIPLVLDHIDGDAENNKIKNLRLVCGNCNMQLPTFAGRNRGKGRINRGLFRYIKR